MLKLIGDGMLAIFPTRDGAERACARCASGGRDGAAPARQAQRRRAAERLPTTEVYLGLHVGEVFYGNIGSRERLDFTVIGPAVNEAPDRRDVPLGRPRRAIVGKLRRGRRASERGLPVSVGRYALRGVERPQELFTLDRQLGSWSPSGGTATSNALVTPHSTVK